jgi:uncharacterized membrane protein YgdD (TMEM256/DUF423 family)
MHKIFLIAGSIAGALGVAIGAFGAHALKATLQNNAKTEVFETAVKYHMYHALGLLLLGTVILKAEPVKMFGYSGYCFITGIVIFSGSLYILSLSNISKWGAITPIGGVFLIVGWVCFLLGILKLH